MEQSLRRGQANRRSRGFTLTEITIALFVFALLTILFASSMVVNTAASGLNGQYAQALSLCQHKIDQLRAIGYGRLNYTEMKDPDFIIDASPTTSPYSFAGVDGVNALFKNATTSLAIVPMVSDNQVMQVTVTITWKSSSSRATNSKATLVGYIANTE